MPASLHYASVRRHAQQEGPFKESSLVLTSIVSVFLIHAVNHRTVIVYEPPNQKPRIRCASRGRVHIFLRYFMKSKQSYSAMTPSGTNYEGG